MFTSMKPINMPTGQRLLRSSTQHERVLAKVLGHFPFNKNNSGLKFRKIPLAQGNGTFRLYWPYIQATARLVIVLLSSIQKSGTGDNGKPDRPKWPDCSKWTTSKAGPEYSGRTKPKWSVPLDVSTEMFSEIWFEWKAPLVSRSVSTCENKYSVSKRSSDASLN